MSNNDIEKKVINIVEKKLNVSGIDLKSKQNDFVEWDSLSYLTIVLEIEKEFGLVINENNFNKFDSLHNIISLIYNEKK
tara:strand:+ start:329 stop:565 length:237 start_codon:yes stop_codon:yes gene_type:complete